MNNTMKYLTKQTIKPNLWTWKDGIERGGSYKHALRAYLFATLTESERGVREFLVLRNKISLYFLYKIDSAFQVSGVDKIRTRRDNKAPN